MRKQSLKPFLSLRPLNKFCYKKQSPLLSVNFLHRSFKKDQALRNACVGGLKSSNFFWKTHMLSLPFRRTLLIRIQKISDIERIMLFLS